MAFHQSFKIDNTHMKVSNNSTHYYESAQWKEILLKTNTFSSLNKTKQSKVPGKYYLFSMLHSMKWKLANNFLSFLPMALREENVIIKTL
jgi:hypothetical protein